MAGEAVRFRVLLRQLGDSRRRAAHVEGTLRGIPTVASRWLRIEYIHPILKTMNDLVRARYSGGAFLPEVPVDLPEGASVVLEIHESNRKVSERERRALVTELIRRMKAVPVPADSPRFTRDQMHERT